MKNSRFFLVSMLLIPILSLEGLCYLSSIFMPELYDHREAALDTLDENEYADFIKYSADPDLGWDQQTKISPQIKNNCKAEPKTYTNLADKIRSNNSGTNPLDATIVAVGDSFTYGADVSDDETYPAALEKKLATPVANLGVRGYCPLQSLINLQKKITLFPHAKIAVLGIMYNDLLRMLNSHRSVILGDTGIIYGAKPYMKSGEIMPLNPKFLQGFQQMKEAENEAFDNDYWARPFAKFPYTFSFIKALASNPFRLHALLTMARIIHQPDYHYIMDMPDMETDYMSLLRHYADFAKEHGLKPVLVFIPQTMRDHSTGDMLIEIAKREFGNTFTYVAVGEGIDFKRYKLRGGDSCVHPSPYGYSMIAEAIAKSLKMESY